MVNMHTEPICLDQRRNWGERVEMLHWDGRLDNGRDLRLRLREYLRGNTSNAALALAAYERWGTDGLVHLIGDWSAVIRDLTKGIVVLASDFAGVRPLYYHVRGGQVLWSSSLESLVEETQISELNEQYIAGFLTFGGYPNATPYKGIYSVPPGRAVCVSGNGTTIRSFWTLPVSDEIRYHSDYRYEEHLRALFREAVAVRLQTNSPAMAELSGGLDSSSVVCMADELIRSGAVPAPRIATVSYVWKGSLDEKFIREVESFCGIEGAHISTHATPVIGRTQTGNAMPESFAPLRASVAEVANRVDAKVVLTGRAGDLVMGNWFDDSLQVAAHMRRLRVGRACRDGLAWSKVLGLPVYALLWRAFRAALPSALSPAAAYAKPDGSYAPMKNETSLVPAFCARAGISGESDGFSTAWLQARPERRKHLRSLSMLLALRSLQAPEPLQHLDYTHPFAHRPLLEFLITVPADVLCGPGEPRRLMRRALSDLWPPDLRKRRSKGLFGAPWHEALQPLVRDLLQSRHFQVVERGYVDRTNFIARLERLAAGLDSNATQLQQIVLLELWLRNRWPALAARSVLRAV